MGTRDDSLLPTGGGYEGSGRSPTPTSDDNCKSCGKPFGSNASTKLYVGNLPLEWTQDELQRNFERFGNTRNVHMPRHNDALESRRFGFVDYYEIDHAAKARYEMNGKEILGDYIKVDYELKKPRPRKRSGSPPIRYSSPESYSPPKKNPTDTSQRIPSCSGNYYTRIDYEQELIRQATNDEDGNYVKGIKEKKDGQRRNQKRDKDDGDRSESDLKRTRINDNYRERDHRSKDRSNDDYLERGDWSKDRSNDNYRERDHRSKDRNNDDYRKRGQRSRDRSNDNYRERDHRSKDRSNDNYRKRDHRSKDRNNDDYCKRGDWSKDRNNDDYRKKGQRIRDRNNDDYRKKGQRSRDRSNDDYRDWGDSSMDRNNDDYHEGPEEQG